MNTDFYQTLGVPSDASERDITAAYRRLARQYHPDVTGGDKHAEERFKEINAAHDVLGNTERRAAYDKWGDQWEHAEQLEELQRQRGAGGFGGFSGNVDPRIFEQFAQGGFGQPGFGGGQTQFSFDGGDLGGILGDLFGGRTAAPARGRDREHPITVSLREAFEGATRTLQIPNSQASQRRKRIEVTIPPGVDNGSRIKISGQGDPSPTGPPGDLYLLISVADDTRFERRGDDLLVDVPVPVTTAALGGETTITTMTGQIALKIPAGTQSERVFRLGGQGMPRFKRTGRGDLLATVQLRLPNKLTDAQRDLFRQLQQLDDGGSA